jgi:hypothetical protein
VISIFRSVPQDAIFVSPFSSTVVPTEVFLGMLAKGTLPVSVLEASYISICQTSFY